MKGQLSETGLFFTRDGNKLVWFICDAHIGNCTTEKERLSKQLTELENFFNRKVTLTPYYTISDRTKRALKSYTVEIEA